MPEPTKATQQSLPELIIRVRKLAQARLVQFAKRDVSECKESYLFEKDHFCGVRFSLGPFRATWRSNQTTIQFLRNGNQIGQIDIAGQENRRAA